MGGYQASQAPKKSLAVDVLRSSRKRSQVTVDPLEGTQELCLDTESESLLDLSFARLYATPAANLRI